MKNVVAKVFRPMFLLSISSGELRRVVAAVPTGRADFLFGQRLQVELRFQPVEDRREAELAAVHRERCRSAAHEAGTGQTDEETNAAAEFGLRAEVEFTAACTAAPTPVGKLVKSLQRQCIGGVFREPRPIFEDRNSILAPARGQWSVELAKMFPQLIVHRQHIAKVDDPQATVIHE